MAAVTEPEVLLDLAGMELESNDSTRLHEVEDGTLLLSLQRAFPVSVAADGEYYEAEISDGTVADVLARAGVTLGPDDYTTPSLDSPVTEGMGRVRVHRVTYTENTARETVPYETEYLDETAESTGKYSHEVLVQAGQDGLVDVTYRQKYVDGDDTGDLPEIQFRRRQPAAGPRGHHGGKQRAQQLQQNVFHEGDRLLFRPRTRRKRPGPVLRYFCVRPDAHSLRYKGVYHLR